jgi:hypothetical protein
VVATASAATKPTVVRATIWPNLIITFSPSKIKRGTIVFKIKNRASTAHEFSINGSTTEKIKPHGSSQLKVTFKRRAVYSATLPDCGYPQPCGTASTETAPTGNVKVT